MARLDFNCISSTAKGGGGSFKNRKPIGKVDCCESGMAERSHWWIERWLMSPLFLSLSLTIYLPNYLSMYLTDSSEDVLNWMFAPAKPKEMSTTPKHPKWLMPQSLFLRRLSTTSEVPKTTEWWNMTHGDFWNHIFIHISILSIFFSLLPLVSYARLCWNFVGVEGQGSTKLDASTIFSLLAGQVSGKFCVLWLKCGGMRWQNCVLSHNVSYHVTCVLCPCRTCKHRPFTYFWQV